VQEEERTRNRRTEMLGSKGQYETKSGEKTVRKAVWEEQEMRPNTCRQIFSSDDFSSVVEGDKQKFVFMYCDKIRTRYHFMVCARGAVTMTAYSKDL
jgi:hypothetical protein